MNEHDATEVAYKNGFKAGYEAGVKEFAKRLYSVKYPGEFEEVVNYEDIQTIETELAGDTDDR